ncbi:unnamed protein product [Kuraishia capsulata CBS 1993]|uniref:Polyadenylation factor subunit 2 n=1 Tax=Kuraishia capsulata CBS 1993 TaxID=1382522 RepID=W6MWI0_9ASCO|nr:uncharacterized protein KUCA_T00003458001 [Kuraishia capsulata CBS 1993]CDK27480.1 unnamed protein product [Kuraishia capsulata CBS 1993]
MYQQRQQQQRRQPLQPNEDDTQDQQRKQKHLVDPGTSMGRYMINRSLGITKQPLGQMRPQISFHTHLGPVGSYAADSYIDLPTRFVHLAMNKSRHAIHALKWTPDARRVLVTSHSGEFTLWNGLAFNFESIMQAHDGAIYAINYSHSGDWLISGDQMGTIKFWQPNFNNVNILPGSHEDSVQDLVFSPNDSKFVSCSDDNTLKIWNFNTATEERVLKGHHWDVKSCDWHDELGLIVSGSKDNLIKLWDPRKGESVATIHDFKHTITECKFNNTANGSKRMLAAGSRDHSARVFDLRTMKSVYNLRRSSETDASSLLWNPVNSNIISVGGYDGSLCTYSLDRHISEEWSQSLQNTSGLVAMSKSAISMAPTHEMPYAHEKAIHAMGYHPLGNLLCTTGADRTVRFWGRSKPGDPTAFKESCYTGESHNWHQDNHNGNGDRFNGDSNQNRVPGLSLGANGGLPGLGSIPGLSS